MHGVLGRWTMNPAIGLLRGIRALIEDFNRASDGSALIQAECLLAIALVA